MLGHDRAGDNRGKRIRQPHEPAVTYNAEVPLLLMKSTRSEYCGRHCKCARGVQRDAGLVRPPGGCGNPTMFQARPPRCYPPAVNYTPFLLPLQWRRLDKTSPTGSWSGIGGHGRSPITGSVLVRFVNAGLRMHVPSIVGA